MATPTPPNTFANASASSVTDGFASANELGGVLFGVAAAAIIILAVMYAASSLGRYERVRRVFAAIDRMINLAMYGVVGVIVLSLVAGPFYYVGSRPAQVRTEYLTYIGLVLAAFVGLAALGYVVERIWEGLEARHEEYTEPEGQSEAVPDGGET